VAALGFLTIAGVSLAVWKVRSTQPTDFLLEAVPLTTYAGRELYPSLSPDGNRIAFSWSGSNDGDLRIYVQQVGGSVPVPLTSGPGDDFSPAWSPDGQSIAFIRLLPGKATASIYLIAALGGVEHQIASLDYIRPGLLEFSHGVEVAWHPGGQWIVVTERLSPQAAPGLCLVSITTGEKRTLIPPPGTPGADLAPAFRPDGKYLTFVRAYYFGASDLYGVRISDDVTPQGAPVRLTSQPARRTVSPVWTPDGRDILFLAGAFTGDLYLWRLQVENPGAVRRIAAAGAGAAFLSTPRRFGGRVRLAYAREIRDVNIWVCASLSQAITGPQL
jgi:Tol biopolymer transport system component